MNEAIEKVTGGFGFQFELRETFSRVFEGMTSAQIDKKLREEKVLRKNQGSVVKGWLYVTNRTLEPVEKCYARLDKYLNDELEDLNYTRPEVTRERASDAGPCMFCPKSGRFVWILDGAKIKVRICEDCFVATIEQMKALR